MPKQKSCIDRIESQWASRKEDLVAMYCPWDLEVEELKVFLDNQGIGYLDDDDANTLIDSIYEERCNYGLSFDYVAPETFEDQYEGYWRYQLSWGGPSDEIRFYSSDGKTLYNAEYHFMDWFDGADMNVMYEPCVNSIWEDFCEMDAVNSEFEKATE